MKGRINRRERLFLMAGGMLAAVMLSYQFFLWYGGAIESLAEQIESKRIYLSRQAAVLSEEESIRKRLLTAREELGRLESRLLQGETPPLAAAELQRLLKEMTLPLGIEIRSEKAASPVDMGEYLGIPVEIGFTATTAQLKDLLLHIEESPLILTVSRLKVRVRDVRNPGRANISMTVRGLAMKKERE